MNLWHERRDRWQDRLSGRQAPAPALVAVPCSRGPRRAGLLRHPRALVRRIRRHGIRTFACNASGTPSPPPWSPTASSCRPSSDSGTPTPPPPAAALPRPDARRRRRRRRRRRASGRGSAAAGGGGVGVPESLLGLQELAVGDQGGGDGVPEALQANVRMPCRRMRRTSARGWRSRPARRGPREQGTATSAGAGACRPESRSCHRSRRSCHRFMLVVTNVREVYFWPLASRACLPLISFGFARSAGA